MKNSIRSALLTALVLSLVLVPAAMAGHAWGNYHWERAANPIALNLGSNFDNPIWNSYLDTTRADWDQSKVLDLTVVNGNTRPRQCRATQGMIEVCSDTYGNTGWLGIASISIQGDHITAATAKMNDTYYCAGCSYDTTAWRNLVMCQEVGHAFGLDHQDENFDNANLNTCMDYTSDPQSNQHPNNHDYQMLEEIYAHLDGGGGSCGCNPKSPKCNCGASTQALSTLSILGHGQWGRSVSISENGIHEVFELDFGGGQKIITHVTWSIEAARIRLREHGIDPAER